MVFADDAAKMNRVLDRMNLDFVKAESGSMVTEAVEKETAPEKTENQMEKESRVSNSFAPCHTLEVIFKTFFTSCL